MVLVLMGLFVPSAFAANLDDPIPQPTMRTELQAGYFYSNTLYQNRVGYITSVIYSLMCDSSPDVEFQKSQPYQLGYWFGFRYFILKDRHNDKDADKVEALTRRKIDSLEATLGINNRQLCECFNIKYDDYLKMDEHNK